MKRYLPHLAVLLLVAGLHGGGYLSTLENYLSDSRFRIVRAPAGGHVAIVDIDGASLRALDSWPWPRRYHAEIVDRLVAAGARVIALDVDFSARSTPADDDLLAGALRRAEGRVVLPVFRQYATSSAGSRTVGNLPIEPFREHVRLAAINVYPESNGQVRRMSLSETIDGRRIPTQTALLAGAPGAADGSFLIDFGIMRRTIPMLSYKDVLAGTFPADAVRGRAVIVGASALELGGQLATPLDPATSGPVLHALAYESLAMNRALRGAGLPVILAVAAALALLLGPRLAAVGWGAGALAAVGGSLVLYAISLAAQSVSPLMLEISPWIAVVAGSYGVGLVTQIEAYSSAAFRRRMEVEQNRAVIRSVVEESHDGIVVVDWAARIHLINRAAADMLAVDADAAVGAPADPVLARLALPPPDSRDGTILDVLERLVEAAEPASRMLTIGEDDRRDIELVVGRTVVPRDVSRVERRAGDRQFYTINLRDITAHRAAQRAQRQAAEMAMEANEAKTLFLANMSHELRTPLNAILGFSELMKHEMFGPLTPRRYRGYVDDIHSSSRHLMYVLNDILDLAKVEAGRQEVVPTTFGVDEIFDECLNIVRGRNRHLRRVIAVRVPDEPLMIRADRRLMLQSVLNLMTNAVKFSDPDTEIVLSAYRDEGGGAVIEVADRGWGIAPEDLESVARPFYQAQNLKKADGAGTGLGLSLVAKYTELHGGTLRIDSEPGVGTQVRIVLPAALVVGSPRAAAGDKA